MQQALAALDSMRAERDANDALVAEATAIVNAQIGPREYPRTGFPLEREVRDMFAHNARWRQLHKETLAALRADRRMAA